MSNFEFLKNKITNYEKNREFAEIGRLITIIDEAKHNGIINYDTESLIVAIK